MQLRWNKRKGSFKVKTLEVVILLTYYPASPEFHRLKRKQPRLKNKHRLLWLPDSAQLSIKLKQHKFIHKIDLQQKIHFFRGVD